MPSPALVEGLEGVRGVAASSFRGLAVTQSGAVFQWGSVSMAGADDFPEPTVIQGLGGVLVRCVRAGEYTAFAISEGGELLSWGYGEHGLLGHGNTRKQRSPKRVKALRDIPICDVTVGNGHALALAEDGVVYAWGDNKGGAVLGNPHVGRELLPKPIEAMRGVRVGSVAAANHCSYCVSNTGEVWAWGCERDESPPLSQQTDCFLPKPIESLRGIKVDAVIASTHHTLAIADDGSVYLWGNAFTARSGALGLGSSVRDAGARVPTPQRIPELRVACGL
jgi:alpha-tubulin suppressor-like RCC1 family protein